MEILHPAFVSYRRIKSKQGHVKQFTSSFHSHIRAVCEEQDARPPFIDQHEIAPGDSLTERIARGMISSRFFFCILSPAYFGSESKWPVRELIFARNIINIRKQCGDSDSKIIYIISVNDVNLYGFLGNDILMIDCGETETRGLSGIKTQIREKTTLSIKDAINCSRRAPKVAAEIDHYSSLVFPEANSPEVNEIIEKYKEANLNLAQTLPGVG